MSRKNWIHQHELAFTHFKILGFPSHLVQTNPADGDALIASCQPVMIAVERLNPCDVVDVRDDTWFVGKSHQGSRSKTSRE